MLTEVMYALSMCETGREWQVLPGCGTEVAPQRYRCPDVRVISRAPKIDRIVRRPPLLCVEILSRHDTWKRLRLLFEDYLAMGVKHVWAFDPGSETAYRVDENGMHRVRESELAVPGTAMRLSLPDVFAGE